MAERRGPPRPENQRGDRRDHENRGEHSGGGVKGGLKSRRVKEVRPDGTMRTEEEEYYQNGEPVEPSKKPAETKKPEEPPKPASTETKGPAEKKEDKSEPQSEVKVKQVDEHGIEIREGEKGGLGTEAVEKAKQQLEPEHQKAIQGHEAEGAKKVEETKSVWQKVKGWARPGLAGFVAGAGVKAFAGWLVRKGVKRAADFGAAGTGAIAGGVVGGGWEFYSSYRSETKRLKNLETYKAALNGWREMSDLEKVQRYLAVKEALAKNKMELEANADKSLQDEFQTLSVFVQEGKWKTRDGADRLEALLKIVKASSSEAKTISAGAEKEVNDLLKKYHLARDKKKIALATLRGAAVGAAGGALGGWLFEKVSDHFGWGHHATAEAAGSAAGEHTEQVRQATAETLAEAKRHLAAQADVRQVHGSVWQTVKEYYQSRGIASPSNKLVNEGMIRISGINSVEITGHHPGVPGSTWYEGFDHKHFEGAGTVEDIKMTGKEILKGFASLDDLVREGGGRTLEAQAQEAAQQFAAAAAKTAGGEAGRQAGEAAARKAAEKSGNVLGWLVGAGAGAAAVGAGGWYAKKRVEDRMLSKKEKEAADYTIAGGISIASGGGGGGSAPEGGPEKKKAAEPTAMEWRKNFAFTQNQFGEVLKGVSDVFAKELENITGEDFADVSQDLRYLAQVLKTVETVPAGIAGGKEAVKQMGQQLETVRKGVDSLRKQWEARKDKDKAPANPFSSPEEAERDRVYRETTDKAKADLDGIESSIRHEVPDNFEKIAAHRSNVYAVQRLLDPIYSETERYRHPLFFQIQEQYDRTETLLEKLGIAERVLQINSYTSATSEFVPDQDSGKLLKAARAKGIKEVGYLAFEAAGIERANLDDRENLLVVRELAERMKSAREPLGFSDSDRQNLPPEVVAEYDATRKLEQMINDYLREQESGGGSKPESETTSQRKESTERFASVITDYCGVYPKEIKGVIEKQGILELARGHFALSNQEFTVLGGLQSLKELSRQMNDLGREAGEYEGMPEELRVDFKAALDFKQSLDAFFADLPEWKWPLCDEAAALGLIAEKDLPSPRGEAKRKFDVWINLMQESGGPLNAIVGSADKTAALRQRVSDLAKSDQAQAQEIAKGIFKELLRVPEQEDETAAEAGAQIADFKGQLAVLFGKELINAAYKQAKKEVINGK